MRKLLIFVAILAVLGVIVDTGAKTLGQNAAANQLKNRLDLAEKPEISLNGFPFLWHAIKGRFPSIEVGPVDVAEQGFTISDVTIDLQDVTFSSSGLLGGNAKSVKADKASGTGAIEQKEVNDFLESKDAPFIVVFEDGAASADFEGVGEVEVDIEVADGELVLRPAGAPRSFSVPLPELLVRADDIALEIQVSKIDLSFDLGRASLIELLRRSAR
jgi:hypothetical protein